MTKPTTVAATRERRAQLDAALTNLIGNAPEETLYPCQRVLQNEQRELVRSANDLPRMLTTAEVARRLGIAAASLAEARTSKRGPTFVRIGRAVRYREDVIDRYDSAREIDGTISSNDLSLALGLSESVLIQASLDGNFVKGAGDQRRRRYIRSQVLKFLA